MVLRAEDNRTFAYAVAASLLLHGLMLVALRVPALNEPVSPPVGSAIAARLLQPVLQESPAAEKAVAPARPARHKAPRTAIAALEAPAPAWSPRDEIAAEAAAPVQSSVNAPDAGSIARYRQQLIGIAVRYKRYPQEALEAGAEGDVTVWVSISPAGTPQVGVKASSGHDLLDAQALEMFRNAAPQVPLPAALFGQAFGVEVRAIYSLTD